MKTLLLATLAGAGALLAATTGAQAASFDLTPLVTVAINDVLVPVLVAVVPVVAGIITLPVKRYLDQKAGDLLAGRVNDLLDKAIAYAAKRAEEAVDEQGFHVNVDGWLANMAADYAVSQAPKLLKQAGALAAPKAAEMVRQQADNLLTGKILARLESHPQVAALKAVLAPVPAAAAA